MSAHRLGPHVVGQRVVIRRLVAGERGPTGGPAFTDLLGVCLSWDGTHAVVQPEQGDPVTIPIRDIVSGKPVPPRPSVRMRIDAVDAEQHTAALFPGLEVVPLAGWEARWEPNPDGRLRKRANSALAMADPDRPVPDALAAVAAFYRERDRPVMVQVEQDSALATEVAAAGWRPVPGGDAIFLLAPLAQLRRELARRDLPTLAGAELDVDGPRVRVRAVGAEGEAAYGEDWLGLHGLSVAPEQRRRGLAGAVLAELVAWGAEQGARTVWLHVEIDNAPARALYDGLGFVEHHRCRYFAPAV